MPDGNYMDEATGMFPDVDTGAHVRKTSGENRRSMNENIAGGPIVGYMVVIIKA